MAAIRRIWHAFLFLVASPRRLAKTPPEHFVRLAWPTMLLSAAWGLILVGVWDRAYHLTWSSRLDWVVPSALCGVAVVAAFRRAATALIGTFGPRRWWILWPALVALAAGIGALINYAVGDPDWPTQLPQAWMWLWPRALYRALVLMGLWGAWGMFAVGQFCRCGPRTDAPTRRLIESTGPITVASALAVPLGASLIYLIFLPPAMRFVPPAAAIAAALGGGIVVCRLRGGACREALLATNFLTQLTFLAAWMTVRIICP